MLKTTALAILAALIHQDIENPEFKGWSNFKPGSWVKMKQELGQGEKKIEMERKSTLVEIAADKITVEDESTVKIEGKELKQASRKREITPKAKRNPKILKEGDEEIEIAGKKLQCHWMEWSDGEGADANQGKGWFCKDVPGGIVRMEAKGEKGTSVKAEAVEWEGK